MKKAVVCALILGFLSCAVGHAGNIDCVKFLRAGDQKICMKTIKQTSPALAAEIDDKVYYASAIPTFATGGVMFDYGQTRYKLCNYDDTEYELIHWLSGTDALVDGVWRDRLADTTSDSGGPMNFVNHGCTWNDEHTGYYSADGWTQYFVTASIPELDFGTDWYMEVVAGVEKPLGSSCYIVDFGAFSGGAAAGLAIYDKSSAGEILNGRVTAICKLSLSDTFPARVDNDTGGHYTWGDVSLFTIGVGRYSINLSRAVVTWRQNRYYGEPFKTRRWDRWSGTFLLFDNHYSAYMQSVYRCGPTTIYDIKIWRKK